MGTTRAGPRPSARPPHRLSGVGGRRGTSGLQNTKKTTRGRGNSLRTSTGLGRGGSCPDGRGSITSLSPPDQLQPLCGRDLEARSWPGRISRAGRPKACPAPCPVSSRRASATQAGLLGLGIGSGGNPRECGHAVRGFAAPPAPPPLSSSSHRLRELARPSSSAGPPSALADEPNSDRRGPRCEGGWLDEQKPLDVLPCVPYPTAHSRRLRTRPLCPRLDGPRSYNQPAGRYTALTIQGTGCPQILARLQNRA